MPSSIYYRVNYRRTKLNYLMIKKKIMARYNYSTYDGETSDKRLKIIVVQSSALF